MLASGWRTNSMAEALIPGPVVFAMGFFWNYALCPTGDRYDGDFKEGKRHGRGVFTWANGVCHMTTWD